MLQSSGLVALDADIQDDTLARKAVHRLLSSNVRAQLHLLTLAQEASFEEILCSEGLGCDVRYEDWMLALSRLCKVHLSEAELAGLKCLPTADEVKHTMSGISSAPLRRRAPKLPGLPQIDGRIMMEYAM